MTEQVHVVPILSGGGARLLAHIGILQALQELGIGFDHLVGVSGGSVVTSLYAAGMSLEEIRALAMATDFSQFRDVSLVRLIKDGGLSSGDYFEHWLDERLDGQRFSDVGVDFHVVATDVRGGGPMIFDRKHTPELKVSKAVRFSMSIPLIFSFKNYRGHILADGSILSEDALFRDWSGDKTPAICFRLKSDMETKGQIKKSLVPLKNYVEMLINTFMNAVSREYVHADHWYNTVVVNTGDLSSVDFSMSADEKEALYQCGYQTARTIIPQKIDKCRFMQSSNFSGGH